MEWVVARSKPVRNFKLGPNQPQPELDCWVLSQHFHLLSSPSYPGCFYGGIGVTCASTGPGGGCAGAAPQERGGAMLGQGRYELSAELQTQTSPFTTSRSSHRRRFQGF